MKHIFCRRPVLSVALGLFLVLQGSSVVAKDIPWDKHKTRMIEAEFAKCVVNLHRKQARKAILDNASDLEIHNTYRSLIDDRCLASSDPGEGSKLAFWGDTFRLAVANALIVADFPTDLDWAFPPDPQPVQVTTEEIKVNPPKGEAGKNALTSIQYPAINRDQFAECVVRKEPHVAYHLFLTKPDSSEEAASFAALQEAMSGCIEGQAGFTRDELRGRLASAFYRLASAMANAAAKN